MHLHTRNCNTAFRQLVQLFRDNGRVTDYHRDYDDDGNPVGQVRSSERDLIIKKPSRNGNVLMIDEPVTITYSHPRERVLFNSARDANPFFHLYEALWMLVGRNDVASVAYYAKQMKEYSDDGRTLNGAYGYRWRHKSWWDKRQLTDGNPGDPWIEETDQLDVIVQHLRADPNSRRAVLTMWNVEDDLLKIGLPCDRCDEYVGKDRTGDYCPHCKNGMKQQSKDVCCNLSVMFSLRKVEADWERYDVCDPNRCPTPKDRSYLDMTVINRSNDLIWGLLGANHVHFTFLQEYMAARLGVEVGKYHHFTNNLHVYDWNWKPEEWLANDGKTPYDRYGDGKIETTTTENQQFRTYTPFTFVPLIKDPKVFEEDLPLFVEHHKNGDAVNKAFVVRDPFLWDVAEQALTAYHFHKKGLADGAMKFAQSIKADDWRLACCQWLERRKK